MLLAFYVDYANVGAGTEDILSIVHRNGLELADCISFSGCGSG